MAKKKKKDPLSQTVDKIIEKAEGIIDKLGMRDLIYTLSYFSAVYISYITYLKSKAVVENIPEPLTFFKLIGGMLIIPLVKKDDLIEEFELDKEGLALSFVAGYMILKIDIEDVSSAITTLSGVIGKIGKK